MAHLLVNLPYVIRMIKTAFSDSDERLEYIARTLGASRFRSFVTVLFPLCRTNLIGTFILTFYIRKF
ncbi:MAG: ABC transporter permease subunit [Lachnospiraceae bacterium]